MAGFWVEFRVVYVCYEINLFQINLFQIKSLHLQQKHKSRIDELNTFCIW